MALQSFPSFSPLVWCETKPPPWQLPHVEQMWTLWLIGNRSTVLEVEIKFSPSHYVRWSFRSSVPLRSR